MADGNRRQSLCCREGLLLRDMADRVTCAPVHDGVHGFPGGGLAAAFRVVAAGRPQRPAERRPPGERILRPGLGFERFRTRYAAGSQMGLGSCCGEPAESFEPLLGRDFRPVRVVARCGLPPSRPIGDPFPLWILHPRAAFAAGAFLRNSEERNRGPDSLAYDGCRAARGSHHWHVS